MTTLWYLCHLFFLFTWNGQQNQSIFAPALSIISPDVYILSNRIKSQKFVLFRDLHTNLVRKKHLCHRFDAYVFVCVCIRKVFDVLQNKKSNLRNSIFVLEMEEEKRRFDDNDYSFFQAIKIKNNIVCI